MEKLSFIKNIKPLNREPVSNVIMNTIMDYLLSKELKPGDKLPTEADFSQQLGVGRNSVREAIKMLSSFGIIEVKRGLGTFIAKSMSPSMINTLVLGIVFEQGSSRELYELRLVIDLGAGELAIQKATDEDIKKLEEANLKLKEEAENNPDDAKALRDLDIGFHYTLLDITQNPLLAKIGRAVYKLFFASMEKFFAPVEKSVKLNALFASKKHDLIIDCIKRKDSESMRKIMTDILSVWLTEISS